MDDYLTFLRTKTSSDVPINIRGRVMTGMAPHSYNVHMPTYGPVVWFHTGLDVNSCTSTAAAVAYWLSASPSATTVSGLPGRVPLSSLQSTSAVTDLLQQQRQLLVFSTPSHKFAVLHVGDEAVLLHSNQDDILGGKKFTLQQYLSGDVPRMTPAWLAMMILNLAAAATGTVDHESIFRMYIGVPFRRGLPTDYWLVPLTLPA